MKLLVATPLYPPELGGPATYAKLLEDELPKKDVTVALVPFRSVRHYPKIIRHIAYFFAVYTAGKHVDAILALDPVSTGLPASLAAKFLQKPFFVKVVGDYAWEQGTQRFGVRDSLDEFVRWKPTSLFVQLLKYIERSVALSAKKIIVPSVYLKKIVEAWGVPSSRIEVIHNAVSILEVGAVPESLQTLPRPRIVSAGRLVPWKGMKGLIDAVQKVRETVPVYFVIVGSGPEESMLRTYAHKKLGSSCVFTGELSHEDTLAVIADSNIFALNTAYEGLSHLLMEALALGTPIVTTAVGGNPELITHGDNGMLVPLGDSRALTEALHAVLKDKALNKRLGASAKKSAERFSIETLVTRTASLIHDYL